MTFGNGALLWGLLLAAVPILIHLLNRRRFKTVRWAAIEFLRAAFKKNQKRLRIENLLLLIVRTAIILFLALAVAKPALEGAAAARLTGPANHYTVLLDNSWSMGLNQGGATPFDRALQEIRRLVDGKDERDSVSLYLTVDNHSGARPVGARAVFRNLFDREAIRIRLEKLTVSAARSELSDAVSLIVRDLDKEQGGKIVTIFTDMQRNTFEAGAAPTGGAADGSERTLRGLFRDLVRKRAQVRVIDVGVGSPQNTGVASVRSTEDRPLVERNVESFEARLLNYGSREETLDVAWKVDGEHKGASPVVLQAAATDGSPGEGRARFVLPRMEAGPHAISAEMSPTDALTPDDRRILAAEVRESIKVLAVDGDPRADSGLSAETLYLRNAIASEDDRIIHVEVIDYLEFLTRDIVGVDVLILANLERVREDKVKAIERFVADGGGLVVFLGNLVDPSLLNRDLYREGEGLLPAPVRAEPFLSTREESTVFLDLDAPAHPLLDMVLGPDVDPTGFWKDLAPKVWGFYQVAVPEDDPDVKVLLRYTDDAASPALLERRFGRGRVLLFTTAADADWNEFPSGGVAIPLMHVMIYYLTPAGGGGSDLRPFERYVLEVPGNVKSARVINPTGEALPAAIVEEERRSRIEFDQTAEPGPYRLQIVRSRGEAREEEFLFAVNVEPEEGDVRRIGEEEFGDLYGGSGITSGRTYAPEETAGKSAESGDISGLLLALVLGLLLLEAFLARRFGDYTRHHQSAEAAA